MNRPKAVFYTLGCKLNQSESEELASQYRAAGYDVADGACENALVRAEVAVVNTCTVTSKAEQKARRLIRALLKADFSPQVIVRGCAARLERAAFESLDKRPSGERRLVVQTLAGVPPPVSGAFSKDGALDSSSSFRSRALLKISDGCDNRCTFCRVRLARGPARSVPAAQLLEKLRALEAAGFAEASLTGVNTGCYSDGGLDLAALVESLLGGTNNIALRLSSLNPENCTEALLRLLKINGKRLRPHIHLSVQSANTKILRSMGRNYDACLLRELMAKLRETGDPFIACDIIAGFPGEGEAEFEDTLRFCEENGFAWIHAFPFSARPGTEAAGFRHKVPEREAAARVAMLAKLARLGKRHYIERWLGRDVDAVSEGVYATSENYLKIALPGREILPEKGGRLRCKIVKLCGGRHYDAEGEVIV
ncbi:MAG: MiaB/RimO family radical SAM methylthiotransferase [Spirochaetaceae bacterium]|jgi:threonylcarbamoyladenosine tRNA methylthiotransferase MtaB|nr:MiaB/RimO family radical SAM methylthiotransferase [Spirochaetaceae bacterium]